MSDRRVLLIGGGGFIGMALARHLIRQGCEVHALSRNVAQGRRDEIEFHRGCQSDAALVGPLLARCNTIVHLASTTTPGRSAHSPALDVSENLLPLAGFLAALAAAGPKRVLFVSSGGAIYGDPSRQPAAESDPVQPLSWHAAGKVAAEAFFGAYARRVAGASLAVVRPSNVYGPGQPLSEGFGIIRTLLEKARLGQTIEIWGSGEQVRDFLYIDDLVEACARLIDRPDATGVFNAGCGEGLDLLQLLGLIEALTGAVIPVQMRPDRGVDVRGIVLDAGRLRAATGWAPKVPLGLGLRRTWEWLWTENSRQATPGSSPA